MALDYGEKFIGVAKYDVGSPVGPVAMEAIRFGPKAHEKIISLTDDYAVTKLICGIPLLLDGQVTKSSFKAYQFAQGLCFHSLFIQDETLSTHEAKERLGNRKFSKEQLDSCSAQVILEDFLFSESHFTLDQNPWHQSFIKKGFIREK